MEYEALFIVSLADYSHEISGKQGLIFQTIYKKYEDLFIVCLADDSQEKSSLNFSENNLRKNNLGLHASYAVFFCFFFRLAL